MERIRLINPKRIEWCCADYGMDTDTLASELKITPNCIKQVIAGKDGLTFNELRTIADYFGRGVLFFLEPDQVNETQANTPQFRTLANHKPNLSAKLKTLIKRVEQQRIIYLSLLKELGHTEMVQFNPPPLPAHDPHTAANIIRQWLELNNPNKFDDYRIAIEAKGILVFRSNGYKGKWQIAKEDNTLGFSLYDPVYPVIFIKKQDWESKQSFTLMHELGHLLLQKTSAIDDDVDMQSHTNYEREANAFAGYLLIPDKFLESINDIDRPNEVSQYDVWLESQRKAWGVSSEVILLRLIDAGRLPGDRYQAYKQWLNQVYTSPKKGGNRKHRYREPQHIFGNKFVRTVLDALYARHITLAKASSYLGHLKINDLHKLEHYIESL